VGNSSNRSCRQQRAGLFELPACGRTEETVVTDLGKTAWQRVLQEAADKLYRRERDAVELLAAIVTIAKGDVTIGKTFAPAVTEGHPKDVA
jgi:hypothetical protein